MNILSAEERERYIKDFKKEVKLLAEDGQQIVVCVPAVHLEVMAKKLGSKNISIGVQNIFWEDKGSFTGEISPLTASNLGAKYVIIGHSERRRYLQETNEQINLKLKAALRNDLEPIFCIGETKEEKENGIAADSIIRQIKEGLVGISQQQIEKIVIAYEPVWAVGSDLVPKSDDILQIKILLRKILVEKYGLETAEKINILYGGSVKAEFVKQVCIEPGLDGVLVGRESLVPRDFVKIVQEITK